MPQIHFIVGPTGTPKRPFSNRLINFLRNDQNRNAVMDTGIGRIDDFVNLDDITLETVRTQITASLAENSEIDDIVIPSYGVSVHINELLEDYPEAAVYVIRRRLIDDIDNEKCSAEQLSNAKIISEIEPETMQEANANTIAATKTLIDNNSLTFSPLIKKMIDENGNLKVITDATEEWKYGRLQVATINLPSYS
jgi:hypothetical protein